MRLTSLLLGGASAASAAAVLGSTATIACAPAMDLQPLFLAQSTGSDAFMGADVCTSIPLSDEPHGPHLYLFGDTLVGRNKFNGSRSFHAMPRNSVGVAYSRPDGTPLSTLSHEWRINQSNAQHVGFFSPPLNDTQWYWPQVGVRTLNRSYVVAWRMEPANDPLFAFGTAGIDVITLPDDPLGVTFASPVEWPSQLPTTPFPSYINNNFTIGNAMANNEADGFVYLLGGAGNPGHAIMSRIPAASFASHTWADLRFYVTGGQWAPYAPTLAFAPLFDFVPSETTLTYIPSLSAWMIVVANTFISPNIYIHTAPNPWGPWSGGQDIYTIPPEMRVGGSFCYAAKVHAELARAPNEFVFTYNCNVAGLPPIMDLPQLYIPQVIRAVVTA